MKLQGISRRILRSLVVGAWIGLLTLPLNIRPEKQGRDLVKLETHLDRSIWIGLGVAAVGIAAALVNELRGRRARAAVDAAASATAAGNLAAARTRVEALRHALATSPGGRAAVVLVPLLLAASLPFFGNPYYVSVGTNAAIYAGLALGLNVVVGQAGLLVLGYAAFYGAGAYTYAILHRDLGVPFWLGLPAGAIVATLFGLALGAPTLRLRGDYLAIVTLGFGEMLRIVLITGGRLTGGPNGILDVSRPKLLGHEATDDAFYWLTLVFLVVTAAVSSRLTRSRLGRAWMAMREDEVAARAMGVNITGIRLLAFSISAFWAGLCGVFFAAKQMFVSPESFTFLESVTVLAMVVLGGMGSISGVIAGALLLSVLPEVLRGVSEYRMITLAALMILTMIFRPQGLFPDVRRRLELEEETKS